MSERRIASGSEKPWLASVRISKLSPTAARTARRRSRSSAAEGFPILILEPAKPFSFASSASSMIASFGMCSQPPSVV